MNIILKFILLFVALVLFSDTLYAQRYGRSDRTNSPAYHTRHYTTFTPQLININVGRVNIGIGKPIIRYERTPSYLPYDYYGQPYGQYYGWGRHEPVFGVRFYGQ